ncbi:hypothetical protein F2P81_007951 [Scophthalmus maximus]|uniref:Uncharacterized protein n=1 Tax=Scophthalmus maximus TaxID=52904 RepID=A0A6A4SWY4_SCOMX|nr:hypothetical protein F2P81_007951 [Scophthalmus maximus]
MLIVSVQQFTRIINEDRLSNKLYPKDIFVDKLTFSLYCPKWLPVRDCLKNADVCWVGHVIRLNNCVAVRQQSNEASTPFSCFVTVGVIFSLSNYTLVCALVYHSLRIRCLQGSLNLDCVALDHTDCRTGITNAIRRFLCFFFLIVGSAWHTMDVQRLACCTALPSSFGCFTSATET